MKLLRVGPPGEERPAVLDGAGRPRDLSGIAADIDVSFFAGGGLERGAEAVAAGGLPLAPAGARVAMGLPDPKPYLRVGDAVEVEIDGLGRQRQEMGQA